MTYVSPPAPHSKPGPCLGRGRHPPNPGTHTIFGENKDPRGSAHPRHSAVKSAPRTECGHPSTGRTAGETRRKNSRKHTPHLMRPPFDRTPNRRNQPLPEHSSKSHSRSRSDRGLRLYLYRERPHAPAISQPRAQPTRPLLAATTAGICPEPTAFHKPDTLRAAAYPERALPREGRVTENRDTAESRNSAAQQVLNSFSKGAVR